MKKVVYYFSYFKTGSLFESKNVIEVTLINDYEIRGWVINGCFEFSLKENVLSSLYNSFKVKSYKLIRVSEDLLEECSSSVDDTEINYEWIIHRMGKDL